MLHLELSFGLSALGYAAAAEHWEGRTERAWLAVSLGLGASIGKELVDAAGFGDPSWKDLAVDVVGVALGTLVAWLLDLSLRPTRSPQRPWTGRTANTGTCAVRTTFSATLPSNSRSRPVWPWVPMTIIVAPCSAAVR